VCLRSSIALHSPRRMTVDGLSAHPPTVRAAVSPTISAEFTSQTLFARASEAARNLGRATHGLRTSTKNVSSLSAASAQVKKSELSTTGNRMLPDRAAASPRQAKIRLVYRTRRGGPWAAASGSGKTLWHPEQGRHAGRADPRPHMVARRIAA
jgi:hypothetical protein